MVRKRRELWNNHLERVTTYWQKSQNITPYLQNRHLNDHRSAQNSAGHYRRQRRLHTHKSISIKRVLIPYLAGFDGLYCQNSYQSMKAMSISVSE